MGACHSSNEGYEWKQFVYRICAKLINPLYNRKIGFMDLLLMVV